jgi:hypothetical protein
MSTQTKKNPFEVKVEAMVNGFTNFPLANVQLEFRREAMTPAQVVQRLQGMVQAIQEERDTDAKHQAAAKSLEKQMPRFVAFYEEAIGVLMKHFGSDARILATFGLRPQRVAEAPAPEVIIIERPPVERTVEVREEVEVPGRGRGDQFKVDEKVKVGGRGGERVEVETRVDEPGRRSRPVRTRRPGRGTRR